MANTERADSVKGIKMKKWTTSKIRKCKGDEKIACITAYDTPFARIFDALDIPFILVGDSVGNNVLGFSSTVPVTMEMMLHHVKAVVRGARENSLVVADLPFMSYQINDDEAVHNAGRMLQEGGADAVKLEGGAERAALVKRLVDNGIPVCAHIGLTPQSVNAMGGYRMQGKLPEEAEKLLNDAVALDKAGAFAVVLECVPDALAKRITEAISAPTIGIGAGPDCDGQILVMHDLLGINESAPNFVKRYASLCNIISSAVEDYAKEVRDGTFPPARTPAAG